MEDISRFCESTDDPCFGFTVTSGLGFKASVDPCASGGFLRFISHSPICIVKIHALFNLAKLSITRFHVKLCSDQVKVNVKVRNFFDVCHSFFHSFLLVL